MYSLDFLVAKFGCDVRQCFYEIKTDITLAVLITYYVLRTVYIL